MNPQKSVIEILPSGVATVSGGTRTNVNVDRPWQTELSVDPQVCPFETRPQRNVTRFGCLPGWRIIENIATPFELHFLIIPDECWTSASIRTLGGKDKIIEALSIASSLSHEVGGELWIGVHVGYSAGQNLPHLHYHVLRPCRVSKAEIDVPASPSPSTIVTSTDDFVVFAGGTRTGQCIFVPTDDNDDFTPDTGVVSFSAILDEMIRMINLKFRSKQGLGPDFAVGIKMIDGRIIYAYLAPILNNLGYTEYFGLLERTPLVLAWSHETTAVHLRS